MIIRRLCNPTTVSIALLVISNIQSGLSIQCRVCNSDESGDCWAKPDTVELVECHEPEHSTASSTSDPVTSPPSSSSENPATLPPSSSSETPGTSPPLSSSETPGTSPPSSSSETPGTSPPSSSSENPATSPPSNPAGDSTTTASSSNSAGDPTTTPPSNPAGDSTTAASSSNSAGDPTTTPPSNPAGDSTTAASASNPAGDSTTTASSSNSAGDPTTTPPSNPAGDSTTAASASNSAGDPTTTPPSNPAGDSEVIDDSPVANIPRGNAPDNTDNKNPSVPVVNVRKRRQLQSRADSSWQCLKVIYTENNVNRVERKCERKSNGCDAVKAQHPDASCFACNDKDGCNSSSTASFGVISLLLPLGIVFWIRR